MAYTTPIFDRTIADITGKTSKGYFNVADWTRIYDNALETRNQIYSTFGDLLTFDTVTTPTTATIPNKTDLNKLCLNIERIRVWSNTNFGTSLSAVKYDWSEGLTVLAPDYTYVNQWEQTIDIVYQLVISATINRKARAGFAIVGSGLTRQNAWRG